MGKVLGEPVDYSLRVSLLEECGKEAIYNLDVYPQSLWKSYRKLEVSACVFMPSLNKPYHML